jgi:hypothetical protein
MDLSDVEKALPIRLAMYAKEFYGCGLMYGIDPLLLAAICDRESLGGEALQPRGAEGVGDGGHGRGLMQIDDRFNSWFTDFKLPFNRPAWTSPSWNIHAAAHLFWDNLHMADGVVEIAIAGYNAKIIKAMAQSQMSIRTGMPLVEALDQITTGGNYVSDVCRRWEEYKNAALT